MIKVNVYFLRASCLNAQETRPIGIIITAVTIVRKILASDRAAISSKPSTSRPKIKLISFPVS